MFPWCCHSARNIDHNYCAEAVLSNTLRFILCCVDGFYSLTANSSDQQQMEPVTFSAVHIPVSHILMWTTVVTETITTGRHCKCKSKYIKYQ